MPEYACVTRMKQRYEGPYTGPMRTHRAYVLRQEFRAEHTMGHLSASQNDHM